MTPHEAKQRFATARVARLATVASTGRPHLVPIVFALDGDILYSAVDHKPKRSVALRRLANIATNPAVSVLADYYDDEHWSRLWWVRADGVGTVLNSGDPQAARAGDLLRERYPQYLIQPPAGQVLAIAVERWSGWAADGT